MGRIEYIQKLRRGNQLNGENEDTREGQTDGALWGGIGYRPCWGCGLGQEEIYLSFLGERERKEWL